MKIQTRIENLKNYQIYLQVEKVVHEFLQKKGYLKVNLPVLSPALIPESYLEVFETEFIYFDKKEKLYLTSSPELFLKRLLAYGIGNCYYLGKSFRNSEPSSSLHSFEFEMLEIYKVGFNYLQLAEEVLEMLRYINKKIQNSEIKNQNDDLKFKINFDKWEKITVAQAFAKYAGIKKEELFDHQLFLEKAQEKGYQVNSFSYEEVWSQVYVAEIEPNLGKNGYPTLIYDYPKEFAALAKLNPDGKTAQRFEFYINGVELGNCYTELTDWQQQEKRFLEEDRKRRLAGKINHPIDKGFIEALKYGLVDCSGIAIGLERLAMIFIGVDSIDKLKLINIET
ncbi:MAG: amino acid--tRNA ligase-related protein [Microgenomates group bacterium]